jgi:hypothetical protein
MKITFLSPVQHDGKPYVIGDSRDIDTAAAQALIDCGSAEVYSKKAKAEPQAGDDKVTGA